MSQMRVGITVDSFSAVCFGARTVETYREFDTHRHPGFGRTGPDLCASNPDLDAAVDALCRYADLDAPIAEALLDHQVACGVGNVFRSEVLWACQQHPLRSRVDARPPRHGTDHHGRRQGPARQCSPPRDSSVPGDAPPARPVARIARRTRRSNVVSGHGSGLAVYGRNGQRCRRCGDTIEVRRLGAQARLLYWCPGCQVRHGPRQAPTAADQRPMDPHPAAAKFLAELPWRRSDTGRTDRAG